MFRAALQYAAGALVALVLVATMVVCWARSVHSELGWIVRYARTTVQKATEQATERQTVGLSKPPAQWIVIPFPPPQPLIWWDYPPPHRMWRA